MKQDLLYEDVVEKAHQLLAWLAMDYSGEEPVLPKENTWQYQELKGRCLELRKAIKDAKRD